MRESTLGLHNREWLSSILSRLKLTPFRAALLMAALHLIVDLPMWLLFRATLEAKGLAVQPADLVYEFLVHPVILGYFCWLQGAGNGLFEKLVSGKIIESETHLQGVIAECRKRLQSRWVPRVGLVLSLIAACWFVLAFAPLPGLQLYSETPYQSWITAHPAIVWSQVPGFILVFYALLMTIYDLVIITIALNDALRNQKAKVEPFHPDKAGGLGFIGRFSANLGYFIGALGLLQSVRAIQTQTDLSAPHNYVFVLGLALYLLLAPTIFFLPMWTTHAAMIGYRDRLLADISTKFNSTLLQLRALRQEGGEQIEALLQEIQQLDEARAMVIAQTPVWPFNVGNLKKFFGLVLSPIVPFITSYIQDYVVGLLAG